MKNVKYSYDPKAPRMKKGKYSTNVVSHEVYNKFIAEFPNHSHLTFAEFRDLWEDIALTIRTEMISNPLGVKLPKYLGELKLQFLPYKYKAVDQNTSAKYGRNINHLNIDEKGKVAKIKWERRIAVKFNRMLQFFAFEPYRRIQGMAKAHIDANPDLVRMSRSVVGGLSIWRTIKSQQNGKTTN